jgi:hypothetical protein
MLGSYFESIAISDSLLYESLIHINGTQLDLHIGFTALIFGQVVRMGSPALLGVRTQLMHALASLHVTGQD